MLVDVFVILVLLVSVAISILRGFIREVLTILGLVGGALAAYIGGPLLVPVISGWLGVEEGAEEAQKLLGILPYETLAVILSYAAVFIIFVILLSILSHYIAEFVKNMGLGAVDRSLGAVFGLARGALVLGLLYLPVMYFVDDKQMEEDLPFLYESKSRVYLAATSEWIDGFLPKGSEEKAEDVKDSISEAQKKLEEMNLLGDKAKKMGEELNEKADGYSKESREGMDKLIEKTFEKEKEPEYNE